MKKYPRIQLSVLLLAFLFVLGPAQSEPPEPIADLTGFKLYGFALNKSANGKNSIEILWSKGRPPLELYVLEDLAKMQRNGQRAGSNGMYDRGTHGLGHATIHEPVNGPSYYFNILAKDPKAVTIQNRGSTPLVLLYNVGTHNNENERMYTLPGKKKVTLEHVLANGK